MLTSLRFQPSKPPIALSFNNPFATTNTHSQRNLSFTKRLPLPQPLCSPQQSHYISTIGSSSLQLSQWNLTQRHFTLLQALAVVTAISTTWLFCSAIPTLLAFKRAAESLEKLMDTTREELPDTMAAIRLSGMEISDLTTELSDIGQEITQGVKGSTRAVHLAEQRLRRLTNMPPPPPPSSASLQGMESSHQSEPHSGPIAVARTARGVREGIVKGRAMLKMFFSLAQFSGFALNFITGRGKR